MKNKIVLLSLAFIFIATSKALAQDPVFTQWENTPIYLNPALAGNFEGSVRVRAQHRDQWRSVLKDASYKTSVLSGEYKFSNASVRKISVGAFFLHDKSGSLDFIKQDFHITSSVVQPLGNPDKANHSLAFGFDVGLGTRKIDWTKAQWPGGGPAPTDLDDNTSYPDIAAGILWHYQSNTHFSYQLGSALHHINKPNISFDKTDDSHLNQLFNVHGEVEIPVFRNFSMIPSFLYSSQEPSEQLLFGFNNRWYPSLLNSNFVQLGFFAKTTKNYDATDIGVYVLSIKAEINSFLFGFSYDRFEKIESNAYEFSMGYTFLDARQKPTR